MLLKYGKAKKKKRIKCAENTIQGIHVHKHLTITVVPGSEKDEQGNEY